VLDRNGDHQGFLTVALPRVTADEARNLANSLVQGAPVIPSTPTWIRTCLHLAAVFASLTPPNTTPGSAKGSIPERRCGFSPGEAVRRLSPIRRSWRAERAEAPDRGLAGVSRRFVINANIETAITRRQRAPAFTSMEIAALPEDAIDKSDCAHRCQAEEQMVFRSPCDGPA